MFPLEFYKVVHLVGIFALFTILGGIALHALNGGTKQTNVGRKLVAALHGVALLVVLVGGFGMLARLGIVQGHSFPVWVWVKIGVWLALPLLGTLPYRKPATAKWVLVALPVLGGLAAYMAIYKPVW